MADPVAWTFTAGGEPGEQMDSLTDVMSAATGFEQRRMLRLSPRIGLEFDGLESGDHRRWLEHLLASNGAGPWWVPFVPEGGALSAGLALGATVVPIDTRWRHYVAGSHALLLGDSPRVFEVVEVEAVADSQLTLASATTDAWPAGTQVFPLLRGRLATVPTLSRFTGDDAPFKVKFRLDPPVDWPAVAGGTVYRDLPVLEWHPDWSADPQWAPDRSLSVVDYETAAPFEHDLVGAPLTAYSVSITAETMEAVAALRSLLYALAGRFSPIWVPSLAQDFRLVANVANGANTLDVARCGYLEHGAVENRRDLRICLVDGTVLYRRVASVAAVNAAVERLTLDAAIATGFPVEDVAAISFLALCRQEADTAVLKWWSYGVASCDLQFRAVPHGL